MQYIRVKYIRERFRNSMSTLEAYTIIKELPDTAEIGRALLLMQQYGTSSKDPEELIPPGALISLTPCDKLGYSKYDREMIAGKDRSARFCPTCHHRLIQHSPFGCDILGCRCERDPESE